MILFLVASFIWRFTHQKQVTGDMEEMPMPPVPDGWDSGIYQYFGESGGHLLLIDFCGASPFIVYEMRTDYSGWFVKHHVDLGGVAEIGRAHV